MRYILTSDIHGCYKQFMKLLDLVEYSEKDQLIVCGDLFDRGPDSYKVYMEIRRQVETREVPPVLIRGNHEQMMFDYYTDVSGKAGRRINNMRRWYMFGGRETEASFREQGLDVSAAAWFLKKRCVYSYNAGVFIAVHGDPRDLDSPHICMWDTWSLYHNDYKGPLAFAGHSPRPAPVYCDGLGGKEPPVLPYGEWLPLPETGLIGIDTGGVFGAAFTIAVIEAKKIRFEKITNKM